MSVKEAKVPVVTRIGQGVGRGAALLLGLAAWGFIIFLMRDFDPVHGPSATRTEVRLLREMSLHCSEVVALGRLAMEKATHEEIRRFGSDQVASYSREMGRLDAWLRERHGLTVQAGVLEKGGTTLARLAPLAGAEFEAAFLGESLRRNALALRHAEHCRRRVGHTELQSLCERVIADLHAQQGQLEEWRSRWYRPRTDRPL